MEIRRTYTIGFFLAFFLCLHDTVASTCGYEACPKGKPDMLNVHIICHTHDDVGWLHTVDNYYDMWVREIITSAVSNLMQNENRRFIYVETAFFSKWWEEQTDLVKEYVTRLVNDGRLEFISGGWSMNDEATTHYLGIIDQMTLGLRWLNETFGSCGIPKVGWQVDTFGHSKEQASLFSQMDFDGLFIGRLHYQDKALREKSQTMEMLWKTSESLGEKSQIFTGVLPNVYWPPKGFCFDAFCSDEELTEDNINYKAHTFIAYAEQQAKRYATNHIVMTMGMDFHFRDAARWFRNLDYLINHINSLQALGMKVNMFYSTPTCYLKSLHESNTSWPIMTSDFFPYASKQHEYWTGYFTSRPALKYHARKSNAFLQICKQLITLADVESADTMTLKKALGIVQHHDGITGTEKQHVADDYTYHLSEGTALCEDAIAKSIRILVSNNTILPKVHFCENLNISQCLFTERESRFLAIIYNSLGHSLKTHVRIPVLGEGYTIRHISRRRRVVPAQVVPIPPTVISLPERSGLATNELIFPVNLPPLGFSLYSIRMLDNYEPVNDIESGRVSTSIQDAVIQNENLQVIIDGYSGLLKEIVLRETGTRIAIKQSFYYYEGMPGYRVERTSGAYVFNPVYDNAFPLAENITYRVFKGPLVEEIHQYYAPWISQTIRLYKNQHHVEFDWVIGPIPVHDHIGREIVTRFDTELENNGIFYTDSNGRQTVRRIRNYQPSFSWNNTENIAGNYYPVTSWIYLKDKSRNLLFSVFPDRAQGGTSVKNGSIELMLHRRLLFDDGFGVNEALNEPGFDGRGLVVRGSHYLTIGDIAQMMSLNKRLVKTRFHYPLVSFSRLGLGNLTRHSLIEFRGLTHAVPLNVHILTLERLDDERILLRLEHVHETSDDPILSKPVSLSLQNLFRPFRVVYYEETTLAANKLMYDSNKLHWSMTNDSDVEDLDDNEYEDETDILNNDINAEDVDDQPVADEQVDPLIITLQPTEIRTFILKVDYRISK